MGRRSCCAKEGLNRGAWTPVEDQILSEFIKTHGEGRWSVLPKKAGLKRCGKSCRLRWKNYLKPDIKRGNISPDEEELIIRLHNLLGNRWSLIAGRLPGRTDNEIKNHWNSSLRKRLRQSQKTSISSNQNQPKIPRQNIVSPSTNNNNNPPLSSTCLNHNNNSFNVIRTKAVKCTKTLIVTDHIPIQQQISSPDPATQEQQTRDAGEQTAVEGSLSSFGDLMIDFDSIVCEFSFSEFMDFDVVDCCNVESMVSSEDMLQDWGSAQTRLDLNRPFTSSFDHHQDWLAD